MRVVIAILLFCVASLDALQGEALIYGRDYVAATPVRHVEQPQKTEARANVLDILLGRATCGRFDKVCDGKSFHLAKQCPDLTIVATNTCCDEFYDFCCSDGTCNNIDDECCEGGGSCPSWETCCGPYRCGSLDGNCCDDGETYCFVGDCYRISGIMQCCITSECLVPLDPDPDMTASGAPPGFHIPTSVATLPPDTSEPSITPSTEALPSPTTTPPVVVTEYYYTHITW
jgi:hypothetical protein